MTWVAQPAEHVDARGHREPTPATQFRWRASTRSTGVNGDGMPLGAILIYCCHINNLPTLQARNGAYIMARAAQRVVPT